MTWKRRTPAANRRRRRRLARDAAFVADLVKRKGIALAERLLRFQLAMGRPFPHRDRRRHRERRASIVRRRWRREAYRERERDRYFDALEAAGEL